CGTSTLRAVVRKVTLEHAPRGRKINGTESAQGKKRSQIKSQTLDRILISLKKSNSVPGRESGLPYPCPLLREMGNSQLSLPQWFAGRIAEGICGLVDGDELGQQSRLVFKLDLGSLDLDIVSFVNHNLILFQGRYRGQMHLDRAASCRYRDVRSHGPGDRAFVRLSFLHNAGDHNLLTAVIRKHFVRSQSLVLTGKEGSARKKHQ